MKTKVIDLDLAEIWHAYQHARASCSSTCDDTDNGQIGDFTFNIPSGATINGIVVYTNSTERSANV